MIRRTTNTTTIYSSDNSGHTIIVSNSSVSPRFVFLRLCNLTIYVFVLRFRIVSIWRCCLCDVHVSSLDIYVYFPFYYFCQLFVLLITRILFYFHLISFFSKPLLFVFVFLPSRLNFLVLFLSRGSPTINRARFIFHLFFTIEGRPRERARARVPQEIN